MSDKAGYKRPPGPDRKLVLKHWIQYIPLRILAFIMRLVPFALARLFGRCVGLLFWSLFKSKRKIATANLDVVFSDRVTDLEKKRLGRGCLSHFGNVMAETLCMPQINQRNFLRFVEWDNVRPFYEGLEGGKGVILCTAHYGNWEIMNLALGYMNLPLSAMARPMDNPLVHDYLEKLRQLSGNRIIYKSRSVRRVLGALAENRIVGVVNDQDVHDHNALFVDFFGRPAATTPMPAAMAYKTGAPIVTGYAVPLGKGRYRLSFQPLIRADQDADKQTEIMRITRLLNERLEQQIEAFPMYWMWIHKRFKTTPEGVANPY
ncbi:MAG: lysophospholipid acyltransferase family protein [Acidobacteriota bacterium]|nr:lysophospholipid acyltransferase family protein [Acidobacteriota bacterium]